MLLNVANTANVGRASHSAPEVATGVYGEPADVYSMGICIFEIMQLNSVPSLERFNSASLDSLPPSAVFIKPLLIRCLSQDPTQRPSAKEVAFIFFFFFFHDILQTLF